MSALGGLANAALRPAGQLAALAIRTEREARRRASRTAGQALVVVAERAASVALQGPLVESVAGDLAEYRVIERATDQLLASQIADDIVTRLLDGPELERIVVAAMESPGAARLVDGVLDSPSAERLVARVIESRLLDTAIERLLASDDLWLLVDEVARSPAVTQAIGHQGMGFAEEVASTVRDRTEVADARVERLARRVFRRPQRPAPPVLPAKPETHEP